MLYEAIETLLVYRVMHQLGYVGDTVYSKTFTENSFDWNESLLSKMKIEQHEVAREINEGLRGSQLVR